MGRLFYLQKLFKMGVEELGLRLKRANPGLEAATALGLREHGLDDGKGGVAGSPRSQRAWSSAKSWRTMWPIDNPYLTNRSVIHFQMKAVFLMTQHLLKMGHLKKLFASE